MGKQRLTIVLAYECVQILDRLGTALQTQRSGRRDDRAKPHPPSSGFSALSEETGLSRRDAPCSVFG